MPPQQPSRWHAALEAISIILAYLALALAGAAGFMLIRFIHYLEHYSIIPDRLPF